MLSTFSKCLSDFLFLLEYTFKFMLDTQRSTAFVQTSTVNISFWGQRFQLCIAMLVSAQLAQLSRCGVRISEQEIISIKNFMNQTLYYLQVSVHMSLLWGTPHILLFFMYKVAWPSVWHRTPSTPSSSSCYSVIVLLLLCHSPPVTLS